MLRADYARIIPVTRRFKGVLLGNITLKVGGGGGVGGEERGLACLFARVCACVFSPRPMCNKMSEVRLSNASPTVERVDVRQPDAARPSVCKNLFGRPEPEEIRRDLAASIRAGVEDFKETYNFDPVADRPLSPIHNNNYDWQEDSDPPEFYVRQPHRGSRRPRGDVRDGRRDAGESSSSGGSGGGERRAAPPDRGGSRKRASASGSCSSESMSKKSKDDCDDEEDPGAAGQALEAAEEEEEARVQ